MRKLQVGRCLLQDEISDLHEQLDDEQARADDLETALNEALTQLDGQTAAAEQTQTRLRTQTRAIANLKVRLVAWAANLSHLTHLPGGTKGNGKRGLRLRQNPR